MSGAAGPRLAAWLTLVAWLALAITPRLSLAERASPAVFVLRFAHAVYNVSIPENSAGRTYATQPPTDDPMGIALPLGTTASGVDVRYRIRAGDRDKLFKAEERLVGDFCFLSIRTRTGNSDFLNRERKDRYRLEVRATATRRDGDNRVTLEADTIVVVTVTDTNDLNPLFYPVDYSVVVPEDTPVHGSVARVSAEDADLGINGEIYYSFAEPTEQFAVHPTSGVVTLTQPLVYSERSYHELVVLAEDRGALFRAAGPSHASRAKLTVRVKQVNLYAPVIYVHHLPDVVENSSTEIYAIVRVLDKDEGIHGQIASLEIVDGDPDGHFRIQAAKQPGEYNIVVHRLLDRERTPQGYNLTLRASDAGTPPKQSYKSVPVRLADANDNAPVFSREIYEVNVPETAPVNTPVIRLKVTDRDQGINAQVFIEIVGGNENGEFFVNPDTGMLYTAVKLDAEEKAFYTLTVSAIDQGNAGTRKQSSAKVKINVIDTNDNDPLFERPEIEVTINENEPTGTSVAKVTAKDRDSGENAYISYSIANLNPVPFEIDHFSGIIKTTQVIDYESMRREFILRLRASDWGLPYRRQTEMQLTIKVKDVNDNRPQFEKVDCTGYIPRYIPIGSEIITLSAIDFDAGNIISYRIISGNEDNCFNLDSTSGVLSLTCDLKDVRVDERAINVTATDGTHFADASTIIFHLVNAKKTSPGSRLVGDEIGAFDCKDTGVARRLTETLAAAERNNMPGGDTSQEDFAMMPSRYGENVHSPEFMDFPVEIKVNESVSLGTSLVKLHARDRDLGYNGKLIYGISSGDQDSAFRIDPETGDLKVIGYLDREREDEYYLNITVYDLGRPQKSVSKIIPITVLDVNDNAPKFEKTLASFRVTENALNGTTIFRVNATDRDSGDFAEISYSLATDTKDFCVEPTSGVVSVCAPLDRERQSLYELVVRARDRGGLYSDALVRVSVDDINDNAPQFSLPSYSVRVREDIPRGAVVAVVDASDRDLGAGGRVRYSLLDDAEESAFAIDPMSGTLRTARALDFEERQVHGLTVRATDSGQPELSSETTVIVEVLDVNENLHAPVFPDFVLEGSVMENRPTGMRVMTVNATDADPPGGDSRLAYTIVGGSGMGYFAVDDEGVIRTLAPLDAETTPHYWLTVCAQDHGVVPLHSCVQVFVRVEDENDNVPLTVEASYRARVTEHAAAGVHAITLAAADADPGAAGLTYRIVAGNPDGLFSVNTTTGEIVTTGRRLDREASDEHALEVRVSDGGKPPLASTTRVVVTLDDINDHAPKFLEQFYSVRVPPSRTEHPPAFQADGEVDVSPEWEGSGEPGETEEEHGGGGWEIFDGVDAGKPLARVLAVDPDAGANGTITYSIKSGKGKAKFHIHSETGDIVAAQPLQPGSFYDLHVRATDGGNPPRVGTARVSVQVLQPPENSLHAPIITLVPPVAAAELDPPGFLLAVVQASDEDGDQLWYDIVGGDNGRDFYIGRENGNILLAKRLVWERKSNYSLNVSVTDGYHIAYTAVNISVINDVNEQRPVFSKSQYSVDVSESWKVNEPVLTLRAEGAGQLVYGLHCARSPHSTDLFRVDSLTGTITLKAPLDRETMAEHLLTVWVRDQALRSQRDYARVLVRVHDADDHAPDWGRRLAQARLWRHSPVGAVVARLRATDRDTGENARIVYSITGGNVGGAFSIDPALGVVTVARALDPGSAPEYTLQVRAANPGPRPLSSTLPLHIALTDPDNQPPKFTVSESTAEIYENEPAGTLVAHLEVLSTSSVWFELVEGNIDGAFDINPAAGVLVTKFPLDYETRRFYNLTVLATNMGGASAKSVVSVHVLDRNEHAPVFLQNSYHGRVAESLPPRSLVRHDANAPLVLTTRDDDSDANALRSFEILDNEAARLFSIDPTTGAVSTRLELDYETVSTFEFNVKVIDMGTPRLTSETTAKVLIDVIDVNDCPPKFENQVYNATLLLPTYKGVAVIQVEANDPDSLENQTLKYDIIDGDKDNVFIIDPTNGVIIVNKPDNLGDSYKLHVRASDGVYSGTTKIRIKVRDSQNSGLVFQKSQYLGSVVENSTKVVTVAVLNVLGSALNEHVEFRILNPSDLFTVGLTSGAVRTSGLRFDRELCEEYVLIVEARSVTASLLDEEETVRVAHTRLTVTVTDVNDNCPVFVNLPYYAAVSVDEGKGKVIARVHAIDLDAGENGEVRYEMKRGHGELFKVDRKSGEISLKQSLEGHSKEYQLVIGAYDGGVTACGSEATVQVRVVDRSQPLFSQQFYSLSVPEDVDLQTALGPPLQATSPLQRQLIYTIVQGNELEEFELDFNTAPDRGNGPCVLRAAEQLDYETQKTHSLIVRATDSVTGAHAEVAVTVAVVDVNDCAPVFPQDHYTLSVSEGTAPATRIMQIIASDNDTGLNSEIMYSISGSGNASAYFYVEPSDGSIYLKQFLDRESTSRHHFILIATDKGLPPRATTAHVWVDVEDINDNPPRPERSVLSCSVSEEASRGQLVAHVAASDADTTDAGRLQYAIAGGNEHQTFAVDPSTGVITLVNMRAFGTARLTVLNVSVSDGVHSAFSRVKVALAAANKMAPVFQHILQEARALENQPPPQLITTVKATDEDFGEYGAVTYSIPSALLRETFSIDASTGALSTRVPLDRERVAEYSVPVVASDGGARLAHTTVRVRVADLNDNAPEFLLKEYRAAVRANRTMAGGGAFLTVKATDADEGPNAKIKYSIYEETTSEVNNIFTINANTGALSLNGDASQWESRVFQFWVRATDGGREPQRADVPVEVYVMAAADVAPVYERDHEEFFLPENSARGTIITQLRLVTGATEGHRFRVVGGRSPPGLFAVDDQGRVTLAGTLDREEMDTHVIGVVAETAGSPPLAAVAQVILHVLDDNDHAPAFHSSPYVLVAAENTPLHASLLKVVAEDKDSGSNGEVRYSLSPDSVEAAELFAIDPYTGWITTLAPLDRETKAEHRFQILATDNGQQKRVTRGTVFVRLRDYNDCPPVFSRDHYHTTVTEDALPGTIITKLEITDEDYDETPVEYYILGGDIHCQFQIRPTGEVFVVKPLDRETIGSYNLDIVATDGKHTATTTLSVEVLDANDNPPYCLRHRYYATLSESSSAETHVLTVQASDADEPPNAKLRFYLSGNGSEHFALDKEAGDLKVAMTLDRETRQRYELTAHVQDRDKNDWECSSEIEILLTDVNDNPPQFSMSMYSVTLPEDVEIGTLVTKVHASDADAGINRKIRYSLADESVTRFRITPDSGIVTLAAPLDRETQSSHRLEVVAADRGNPSRSARAFVVLTVSDVNDNPPEFEFKYYEAVVPEIDAVGTEILRVMATSKDTGINADVYYSIIGGNDHGKFAIDSVSGILSIAQTLDYERSKEYFLTVQAVDGGIPPLSNLATVNITITDSNDNPPTFTQINYDARIREDAPIGENIIQVIADDADSGLNGRVTYSIERGDKGGHFTIDKDTGYISVATSLDRETQPGYALEVHARDNGLPVLSNFIVVNVEIEDANDNPPLFSQSNYTAVVQEDKPLGFTILKFNVRDADEAPNAAPYTYDFQSGNEAGAFRLEQDGYLRTASRFNHKIKDRYNLLVRVFDNGTPPLYSDATVVVKVIEESQYPPVITPLEVAINSYLDEYPGGVIGKVFATDQDAYDTLTYSLAPTNGIPYPTANLFEINRSDGTLTALPRLDVGEYRINVTVTDGKFVSSTIVKVSVELVSDEMLANSVVVRFREVNDRDFVLSHRKGFIRAVRNAMNCKLNDIVIISVQPSSDDVNMLLHKEKRAVFNNETLYYGRIKRQVAQDLDVLFAVRKTSSRGVTAYHSSETIRKLLNANLEELEESTKRVVEEIVRNKCSVHYCANGECAEKIILDASKTVSIATDVSSLVCPLYLYETECRCAAGFGGTRCEQAVHECARKPCPEHARCVPSDTDPGYRCVCTDTYHCELAPCVGANCDQPADVVSFDGKSFAQYRIEKGIINGKRLLEDQLTIFLRFRTMYTAGTLMYAAGRIDYNILEIADGHVQYRLELGSGEAVVRADTARVSDGAWHEVRLERAGNSARLTVDGRHIVHGAAPGDNQILDLRADHMYLGGQLHRHPSVLGGEEIIHGFVGCMSSVKLGQETLQLLEAATPPADPSAPRAALLRLVHVVPACPVHLDSPGRCGSMPCLNGGTCREVPNLLESGDDSGDYECSCHERFLGRDCEIDSDPCASQPCLHGGICRPLPGGEYECTCGLGLQGQRCERGRWCGAGVGTGASGVGAAVCAHGGVCEEGEWGPACRCHGYYGPVCQYDVDECAGEPCLNGATCINEPGSFHCVCPPDKTGMNCGNPLYADAVRSGVYAILGWRWEQLAALGGAACLVLMLSITCIILVAVRCRRRRTADDQAKHKDNLLNSVARHDMNDMKRGSKLSNLEAVRSATRERPVSCAPAAHEPLLPPPHTLLNNLDTLRSYGSAGDELENIPPDYRRNLNPDSLQNNDNGTLHKPSWSEQMHLQTFQDNKIYNDLKGNSGRGAPPATALSPQRGTLPGRVVPDPRILGGYHWDCSDWCNSAGGAEGALPGISEVAGSELPDSSSPHSDNSDTPRRRLQRRSPRLSPPPDQSSYTADDDDADPHYNFNNAHSYLLHPDTYLPHHAPSSTDTDTPRAEPQPYGFPPPTYNDDVGSVITMLAHSYLLHPDTYLPHHAPSSTDTDTPRAEPQPYGFPPPTYNDDVGSVITMLEERNSLLGRSTSDISTNLCEIEESDCENDSPYADSHLPLTGGPAVSASVKHTDV